MAPPKEPEFVQGSVDVLALKALSWAPMHGYALSKWVRERTDGVVALKDAALYQGLHRLERQGLVKAEWTRSDLERRARVYRLTAEGRARLLLEAKAWRRYAEAMLKVLATRGGEA
jgi:PadR family transcriptional regulator PadR